MGTVRCDYMIDVGILHGEFKVNHWEAVKASDRRDLGDTNGRGGPNGGGDEVSS